MPKKKTLNVGTKKYFTRVCNGKKFYSSISQADADAKAEQYRKLKERSIKDPDISVADYVVRWYEGYKNEVGPHTADHYYYCCRVIIEYLGYYKLTDTTPMIIENCMKEFAATKSKQTDDFPSQKYITSVVSVLKLIYKQAKKEQYFDYNYAEDIRVRSKKVDKSSTRRRSLTPEEINRVLNFKHKFTPVVWFMLLCGLMPEEVVPLQWKDITYDVEDDMYFVSINKTAYLGNENKGTVREGQTKTEFRMRTIPIPAPLSEWIKKNIKEHGKKEYLFTDKKGDVLSKSSITGRFQTYLIDLDCSIYGKQKFHPKKKFSFTMDKFCMYDLRHTYITLLVSIDTPIRKTTALAGHSGSETADKYYIDYQKVSTNDDIRKLENHLKNLSKEQNAS